MGEIKTLNYLETLRGHKQISGDAFNAEGLFMNELVNGKPVGVTDPEIHAGADYRPFESVSKISRKKIKTEMMQMHDGGFDANAGKNPPEEGEMHIGFKIGGGAYDAAGDASMVVGAFEAKEAKAKEVATWKVAGVCLLATGAVALLAMRHLKAGGMQALMYGAVAGLGTYFVSDKIIKT